MRKEHDGAVIVQQTGSLNAHLQLIADQATRRGLPTVHASRLFAESGGLLAYGPSLSALGYRAASYVDKILKGAKPADLPGSEIGAITIGIVLLSLRNAMIADVLAAATLRAWYARPRRSVSFCPRGCAARSPASEHRRTRRPGR